MRGLYTVNGDVMTVAIEELRATYEPWKNTHSKAICILCGTLAWSSIFFSTILIWMVRRSRVGLSSTFHRLLLMICVVECIVTSVGYSFFNLASPTDVDYMVWNASGTLTTCSIQGIVFYCGTFGGLLYHCSLNLYYMIVVKFNASDEFIQSKVEPWLHGIPIVLTLVLMVAPLLADGYNVDTIGGDCWLPPSEEL